jgi:mannitol/fructose-specific phosphotransferase system IIA component (Ntr-type)
VAEEPLRTQILQATLAREEQASTGVGAGLAFPHARIPDLKKPLLLLATLQEPLAYGSIDEQPVRLLCLVAVPAAAPTVFLKIMAQLSRFFADEGNRQAFLECPTPEAAFQLIRDAELPIDVPILLRDIMRPPLPHVYSDMPLKDATHQMLMHHIGAVAVLDRQERIVGELNCDQLFRYGLPDFFSRLQSVSFIREFDPFEKYFEKEANCVAGDVMDPRPAILPEDGTLLEAVFALAVQKHTNLYVVDAQQRWVGIVDRIAVLDNIIHM